VGVYQNSIAVSGRRAAIWRVGIAGDRVVSFCDVVKNARISGDRDRRGITARTVLCRQFVENIVGVALPRARSLRRHFLIDQCHDAREGRCRSRGTANANKSKVRQAARFLRTKNPRVGLADNVKAVIEPVAGEKRDVGHVPHSVEWHPSARLPGGLAVAGKARAITVLGRAITRAAAPGNNIQEIGAIKTLRESEAGAGIIPGRLRNVGEGGCARGRIVSLRSSEWRQSPASDRNRCHRARHCRALKQIH